MTPLTIILYYSENYMEDSKFDKDVERERWRLSDEELKQNIDEIFEELSIGCKREEKPSFILIGGQAGSGKSGLVSKKFIEKNTNAIIIDQDELRPKFPREKYKQIHDGYTERQEFLILNPYIADVIQGLIERASKKGYNIILESALQDPAAFIDNTRSLRSQGYYTELDVMSVSDVEANISMLERYCFYLLKDGECRRNTRLNPEALKKLKENLAVISDMDIFDDICVFNRGEKKDDLPVMTYSKAKSPDVSPNVAFEKAQRESFKTTKKNFDRRYEAVKMILERFNETEQLEKLEKIKAQFEEEKEME